MSDDSKNIINLFSNLAPDDTFLDLNEEEQDSALFYLPFFSLEEIKRIFNPSNVRDELLRLRADSILSNIRIVRTFHHKRHSAGHSWNIMNQFDDKKRSTPIFDTNTYWKRQKFDYNGTVLVYIGRHPTEGAATSIIGWFIWKYIYANELVIDIELREGIWDDRASLSWS